MNDNYGRTYPGSGSTNPFAGGPDFYPLNSVTWVPQTREVVVETCGNVRMRIPADGFVGWVKQTFGAQPKYRDELVCRYQGECEPYLAKRYDA